MNDYSLMLPKDAARLVGVSGRTISRWIDAGKLAGFRTPYGRMPVTRDVLRVVEQRRNANRGG